MICLASSIFKTKQTVVGWGDTENRNKNGLRGSNVLLKIMINVIPLDDCKKKYKKTDICVTETQFCNEGNKNGAETCVGDSGGPSFARVTNNSVERHTQFGIVSVKRGKTCGSNQMPTIFTKVYSYINWIVDHMEP